MFAMRSATTVQVGRDIGIDELNDFRFRQIAYRQFEYLLKNPVADRHCFQTGQPPVDGRDPEYPPWQQRFGLQYSDLAVFKRLEHGDIAAINDQQMTDVIREKAGRALTQ